MLELPFVYAVTQIIISNWPACLRFITKWMLSYLQLIINPIYPVYCNWGYFANYCGVNCTPQKGGP